MSARARPSLLQNVGIFRSEGLKIIMHDGHLYASAWTGATDDQKAVALVMASRLIDAEFQFNGTRTNAVQGLQWPRARCPEPDAIHVPLQVLLPIPSTKDGR